jgi:hypothetical protein
MGDARLSPRHCERNEAIHSAASGEVDCFVASLPCTNASRLSQAMTWIWPRDLAALIARGLPETSHPRKQEGAGKTGCMLHPRSRVQLRTKRTPHTSIQVQRKHSGLPCAMALRLTSCSPRRTALLPPSPARSLASRGLNASTATSGPHDFAVRIRRLRLVRHQRPPHPTARS